MPTDTNQHRRAPLRTLGEVSERMDLGRILKDPERFLARQARTGKIRARKVGRSWLMTDADVELAIESFANNFEAPEPAPAPVVEPMPVAMPSKASQRRRRAA